MNNQGKPDGGKNQNARSSKFDEVNPRHDDMGFASEDEQAAAAAKKPVHYSSTDNNTAPDGSQNMAYGAIPNTNPVESDNTGNDSEAQESNHR